MQVSVASSLRGCFGRRQMLAACTMLGPPLLTACTSSPPDPLAERRVPPDAPTLYYVFAADCPYCNAWNDQFRGAFEASDLRAKLHFHGLQSPTVRLSAYPDAAWPTELRWIRGELQRQHVRGALPMFVLVHHDQVVASAVGEYPNLRYGWPDGFYQDMAREADAS